MGCGHHLFTIISLLFLFLGSSSQGRMLPTHSHSQQVEVEKMILRGQIGSRPPRCERRCGSCGHCEAIQVPTTPQTKATLVNNGSSVKNHATLEYARGDYSSNYKPMSWKCKCGSFIFNP